MGNSAAENAEFEQDSLWKSLRDRDIVFFDGNCVLCHNLVRFILKADKRKHFLLSAQQSDTGCSLLQRHAVDVAELSTIYVLRDCLSPKEKILSRSSATLYIFSKTPSLAWLAVLLALIPAPIRDFAYKCVAASRYRLFGTTYPSCLCPAAEDLNRIIG